MFHMTLLAHDMPNVAIIPQWTMADRLRKARELTGLDQGEFAERCEISRQAVGNYESGRRNPRGLYLRAWAEATGVPVEWLETGKAPADAGAEVEPPAGIEPATYSLQVYDMPDTVFDLITLWGMGAER